MKYTVDTNILLANPEILKKGYDIVVPSIVLREIENLERKKDQGRLQLQVRVAKRALREAEEAGLVTFYTDDYHASLNGYSDTYADNIILEFARATGCGIISNDILLLFKAKSLGLEILELEEEVDNYLGYQEVELSQEDTDSLIYQNLDKNIFSLGVNEYLHIVDPDTGKTRDLLKWTGEWLERITDNKGRILKKIVTHDLGSVTAKDVYQVMAMDSIENHQVTMLRGKPGSGKTLLAVSEAWNLKEKEGYRVVVFYNPTPSKDAIEIGFYPGDNTEKFLSTSAGNMLKAKFGGEDIIRGSIISGDLEILPFVDLRGWDSATSDGKTIVLILEAQNLTTELLKMGLQRIDENTKVIIDGDYEQQIDKHIYANDNGMKRASEILRGEDLYGEVKLKNVYRSRLADIVDKM